MGVLSLRSGRRTGERRASSACTVGTPATPCVEMTPPLPTAVAAMGVPLASLCAARAVRELAPVAGVYATRLTCLAPVGFHSCYGTCSSLGGNFICLFLYLLLSSSLTRHPLRQRHSHSSVGAPDCRTCSVRLGPPSLPSEASQASLTFNLCSTAPHADDPKSRPVSQAVCALSCCQCTA